MSPRYLQQVGASGQRVDGIDVTQLLHALGEASAASSAVDLFGLCMAAQRVVARVHADAGGVASVEFAWLAAFRKMDDCSRANMLPAMQAIAENFPRRAPAVLTLVQADQRVGGGAR